MKAIKQNLFLAAVLAFAVSSSGCALLGGLLGGGGGGGIMDMLGGLGGMGGMTLTDDVDTQNALSLSGPSQARVKNGYQIRATGSLPTLGQKESTLYGTYSAH
jgi:hypothetical protein